MMCLWRRMPPQKDPCYLLLKCVWSASPLFRNSELIRWHFRFGQYKSYSFDAATSCEGCSDEDEVTIINVALLGVIDMAQGGDGQETTNNPFGKISNYKIILSNGLKGFQIAESICGRLRGDAGGQWCKIQATLEQLFGHTGARCTHCMFVAQGKTRKGPCTNDVS